MAKRILLILVGVLLLVLLERPVWTATPVAYDSSGENHTSNALGGITSSAFTIGSGTNRARAVAIYSASAISGLTVTCGGVTASAVSGASGLASGPPNGILYAAVNPASGSQTAAVTWTSPINTTAVQASIVGLTVTGANQTTPMNGGTAADFSFGTSRALGIVTNCGDLTMSIGGKTIGTGIGEVMTTATAATVGATSFTVPVNTTMATVTTGTGKAGTVRTFNWNTCSHG